MAYELKQIAPDKFQVVLDNDTFNSKTGEVNLWAELSITTSPLSLEVTTHSASAKHILERIVASLNALYWQKEEVKKANYSRYKKK